MKHSLAFFLASFVVLSAHAAEKEYIEIIQFPVSSKGMEVPTAVFKMDSNTAVATMKAEREKIEKSVFQKAVQSAIKELEGSMSGTCARSMTVTLKVDATGKWAIVEVGIGGTLEVEIFNPKFPKSCAR